MAQLKDTTIDGDLIVNGNIDVAGNVGAANIKSYTLSYPTDMFSTSQCLCQRSGYLCHVYVSLKTSREYTDGVDFSFTGHPIVPMNQYMRTIDFNAQSVYIGVEGAKIDISVSRNYSVGEWIRFAFTYVCTD